VPCSSRVLVFLEVAKLRWCMASLKTIIVVGLEKSLAPVHPLKS